MDHYQFPFFFFVAIYASHVALLRYSFVIATSSNPVSSMTTNIRVNRPLVVGLNPALQRTITVPHLKVGSVNRGSKVLVGIGGKGQNAVVAANQMETSIKPTLLQILGQGFEGDALMSLLHTKTDSFLSIRTKATCRVCITLLNGDESTEIIEPSENVLPNEIESLLSSIQTEYLNTKAPSIAIMGSMPKGCPSNLYASIISKCAGKDTKILLDTVVGLSDSLKVSIALGSSILLKVNVNELLSLAGMPSISSSGSVDIVREACIEFLKSSCHMSTMSSTTTGTDASKPSVVSESVQNSSGSSSSIYIAVTDGPHPSHLLKLPLSTSSSSYSSSSRVRQWVFTSPQLPGSVVSPIGAGDATSSGTLMYWSNAIDNNKVTAGVRSTTTTIIDNDSDNYDRNVVDSFRWGIACGGASCLSANSVFTMTDAIAIFNDIKVTEVIL